MTIRIPVFALMAACGATVACLGLAASVVRADAPATGPKPIEGDYVIPNYHFASGETLPELRLHFTTLGKAHRDAQGRVDNAVLILHGTGGSGHSFLIDRFAGVLFGKGQLLDSNRYYIILPDGIGHGSSSKPSDGLHSRFPQYDYEDMVAAQHALATQGLRVDHLRLVIGTSMGCMHTFMWAERYPDFMDAADAARLPARADRRTQPPVARPASWTRSAPIRSGSRVNTAASRRRRCAPRPACCSSPAARRSKCRPPCRRAMRPMNSCRNTWSASLPDLDANDLLYQVNASRDYDPSAESREDHGAGAVDQLGG